MHTARFATVVGAALLAACGVAHDPSPEDVEIAFRIPAGVEEEHRVPIEDGCGCHDPDYWKWDDHVRDLPYGFSYRTLAISEWDGRITVRYEIYIEPWVDPGPYDFRVIYELWPDDDLFRDEYDVDFLVHVDPPGYVPYHVVAEQELTPQQAVPPTTAAE